MDGGWRLSTTTAAAAAAAGGEGLFLFYVAALWEEGAKTRI